MRTLLMAGAAGATLLAGGFTLPTTANATPLARLETPRLVEHVDHPCPELWICTRFACGWSFVCGWRPGSYYYGPSVYVRPYRAWRREHSRLHR